MANVKTSQKKHPKKSRKAAVAPAPNKITEPAGTTVAAPTETRVPGAWRHLSESLKLFGRHWKFFTVFTIVYAVLSFILVHNFSADIASVKSNLSSLLGHNTVAASVGTYALLLTTSTSGTSTATAAYQYILFVIASLAVIWALRQFLSDKPKQPGVKDSFYEGMYPLVQFVMVLIVLTLELIPMVAAAGLYGLVVANGVAVTAAEQWLWVGIFISGTIVTLWMLTRTIFALYIVTLPGAKPIRALKDSVRITKAHQFSVACKLLLLLVFMLVAGGVLLVPVIAFAAPLAGFLLFLFSMLALPFTHTYAYGMYRELLV
jgi:hypothetical protein